MTTRVLLATNGGRPARDAGELVRRLAAPGQVAITVNVCDSVEFSYPLRVGQPADTEAYRPEPEEVALEEVARFEEAGFKADHHIGIGVPAGQILEKVEQGDYDVAVLGAGSSSWLGNLLLGSTSMRVLHASDCSVMIVHKLVGDPGGPMRVLLATDGSPDAELAVRVFLTLADPARAQVKVVSISDLVPISASQYDDRVPAGEVVDHLRSKAVLAADRAAQPLVDAGFTVEVETPDGNPAGRILERAEHSDLVVVGSRGLGPATRLALGSVSDQVARLAPAALVCRS